VRLAVISDIHGNLAALETVLADAGQRGVAEYLCLGDVAATGPQPHEVVARVRALGCPVVMGNTDAWLLDPPNGQAAKGEAGQIEEIDRWCASQLSDEDRQSLRAYQPVAELEREGVRLLGVHGSPRSFHEGMLATTPGAELDEMLGAERVDLVLSGHTHAAMLRRHRALLLVNPGSVGLPYDQAPAPYGTRNPLWAEYAVITCERGTLGIELVRVGMERERIVEPALASGMPHANYWVDGWETA
jgi:putative phosphoesterase